MKSYELYIPIERPQTNPTNGRFLPGHIPHNKGKKWTDYMDVQQIEEMKSKLRERLPRMGRKDLAGWNARPIVAYDDEGNFIGWFASSNDAMRKTGICARNIRSVLVGKRQHAGGYRWIYDNNNRR